MAHPEPEQKKGAPGKGRLITGRRLVVAACLLALAAAALVLLLRPSPSVEKRLRAIDAAYAIPEGENAAGAYMKLARECLRSPQVFSPMPKNPSTVTPRPPWRNDGELQAAKWLEDRQSVIDSLMDIGRKPKCWFSVVEARRESRSFAAQQWSLLLLRAADYDLGEGRTDAGLEKLLGMLRLARHFRTQISPSDSRDGRVILVQSLQRLGRLAVTEEVPLEWLTRFEAALPPAQAGWTGNDTQMEAIKRLYEQQRERSTLKRLTDILIRPSESRLTRRLHLMEVGWCRATRVLLALRRYRNETGTWPKSLREIEDGVSPEVLIDPLTGKPFIYRLTDDGVLLYSVGWNHVDESGGGDDTSFWPNRMPSTP